jgi:hypothetical protein
MLTGCVLNVPVERVYGTYVATYPYGTETMTLNSDGTLIQRAAINKESPLTVRGRWEFDPAESRVSIHGVMIVDDGFGHLKADWQTVTTGLVSFSVEMHWFRVVIGSGLRYPYTKK